MKASGKNSLHFSVKTKSYSISYYISGYPVPKNLGNCHGWKNSTLKSLKAVGKLKPPSASISRKLSKSWKKTT